MDSASEAGAAAGPRALSPLEARVLAVLVEKQLTVPDTYPLSLNALTAGCNQKTARDPVMAATEAEVQAALDELRRLHLVQEVSGSRVTRYEHNMPRVYALPGAAVALLVTLMLRGPQTAAELRTHSERLHRFADLSSVEAFLDELAAKRPPRVVKLPRAAGSREARWAQLLSGEPPALGPALAAAGGEAGGPGEGSIAIGELAALRAEQARMAAEIAALRAQVARIATELGLANDT